MANRPGPVIQGHIADPGIEDYPESVAPMGTSGSTDGPLIMRNVFAKFNFVSGSNGPEQPPFSFYVPGPASIRFRNKAQVVVHGSEIESIVEE
tara:strand:- start:1863 stop:2141 length:279 start_codon:yes stop_codon:yes gene_type:complete